VWGDVDLRDPVADRTLVDLSSGEQVPVTDSEDLLFPASLPAPFDVEVFEVANEGLLGGPQDFYFRFTADDAQYVLLSQYGDPDFNGTGCDVGGDPANFRNVVEVRGVDGCFDTQSLTWDENGRAFSLTIGITDSARLSDDTASLLDDLLEIAERLE
jgi:hypothetical protein